MSTRNTKPSAVTSCSALITRRPEALEELAVAELARAAGLAFLGIDEHEVDVRGHVELAAAELAHRDDHELLRPCPIPRRSARRSPRTRAAWCRRTRGVDRKLGELRDRADDLAQIGPCASGRGRSCARMSRARAWRSARARRSASPPAAAASIAGRTSSQRNGCSSRRRPAIRRPRASRPARAGHND